MRPAKLRHYDEKPDRPARRIPSDLGARYELRQIRVGAWEELPLPAPSSGRVELGASNSDTSVDCFVFHKALCPASAHTHNVRQMSPQLEIDHTGRRGLLTTDLLSTKKGFGVDCLWRTTNPRKEA